MDEARARLKDQAMDAARSAGDAGMQAVDVARHKGAELAQSAAQAGRQTTDTAWQKAAELTDAATQAGRQATDMARQKAAELTDAATQAGRQAADAVRSTAADWTSGSRDRARPASRQRLGASPLAAADLDYRDVPNGYYDEELQHAGTDGSNGSLAMDKVLLGAAGVAVAAAVAIAYQRGSNAHPSPDELFRSGL